MTEAKYDGQSLQEVKISRLAYTLCLWLVCQIRFIAYCTQKDQKQFWPSQCNRVKADECPHLV